MVLNLKTYPEPCLKRPARSVDRFSQDTEAVVRRMAEVMYISQGIGLAAPQVGLDVKIIVADVGDGLAHFINPQVLSSASKKSKMEEGCLSLPGVKVEVMRPVEIEIKAQDVKGKFFEGRYEGIMAKVLQHEMDHLEGRVIIDYLNPVLRFAAIKKMELAKRKFRKESLKV